MTVYGTAGLFVMAYKLPDKDQAVGPFVHASIFQDEVARRTEAERQLQTLASELTMAENRERERIAVILHNDLQQVLVALKYHIASLVKRTDQQATEICLLVDEALDISRSLITELSPPALRNGLAAALEWLVAWMSQKLGFAVTLRVENISPITKEVESFAFQAVRELLLNAAKHSNARAARVQAQMNEEILELAVEDEGIGFHPSGLRNDPGKIGGLGLASIQERVALLGGKMEIQSAPGKGSQFRLQLPCRPTSRDGASQNNERL
jgi:signal transduction histidine kinase